MSSFCWLGYLALYFSCLWQVSSGQALQSPVAVFSTCGATGPRGPDQRQCEVAYGDLVNVFSVVLVNGITHITTPFAGIYRIQAFGASGLDPNGGKGAFVSAEFPLPQGANIKLLVGQQAEGNSTIESYGGSGGSFVFRAGRDEPMLVAGGGATPKSTSEPTTRLDGSAEKEGKNASDFSSEYGKGGAQGYGGLSGAGNMGGGGAGFFRSGVEVEWSGSGVEWSGTGGSDIQQAQPFLLDNYTPDRLLAGRGGTVLTGSVKFSAGGFGGGGYALADSSGGGGGYSGGGGASNGSEPGGGGSYSSGMNSVAEANHTGEGLITFQFIGSGFQVTCNERSFIVAFHKELVYGLTNFTLNDSSCVSESNATHVIMTSGLNECGTTVSMVNDAVLFKNTIKESGDKTGIVARRYTINDFTVTCSYSVRDAVTLNILPELAVLDFIPKLEEGDFLISMRAYNSSDFEYKYTKEHFPLTISTHASLFLEVGLSFENQFEDLKLLLEDCFASPSANSSDSTRHMMIENGCVVDETLEYFPSVDDTTRRFMFKAVSFTAANFSSAFVHCQALLCNASEASRCEEGCKRQKRSSPMELLLEVETRHDETTPSHVFHEGKVSGAIGPFIVKDDDVYDARPAELNQTLIIVASTLSIALLVVLLMLAVYAICRRRKRSKSAELSHRRGAIAGERFRNYENFAHELQ